MSKHSAFYNSMAWQNTSRNYKQSVGGLCERCLANGIVEPAEIVHHKIPLTDKNIQDLSISLSWDNLEALCRKCHADVHEDIYAKKSKRRYKIDRYGKVVIRDDTVL